MRRPSVKMARKSGWSGYTQISRSGFAGAFGAATISSITDSGKLLGAVKFGDALAKTQKKLQEASNTVDAAATRTRAIERRLRGGRSAAGRRKQNSPRYSRGSSSGPASSHGLTLSDCCPNETCGPAVAANCKITNNAKMANGKSPVWPVLWRHNDAIILAVSHGPYCLRRMNICSPFIVVTFAPTWLLGLFSLGMRLLGMTRVKSTTGTRP